MKFTEKDLLKAMGLEVGDLIRIKWDFGNSGFRYCVITKDFAFQNIQTETKESISMMVGNCEYEKIKQPGTYGNLKCTTHIDCEICPLRMINCDLFIDLKAPSYNSKLKNIWKNIKESIKIREYEEDKDINRIIEQRLDQYIVDEELKKLVEQDEEGEK